MVPQYRERKKRKQLIYVLGDVSSSMGGERREMFMKAVMISLGRKAIEDTGRMFYRFFESSPHALKGLTARYQWPSFSEEIIDKQMSGGTSIHNAVAQASEDIEKIKEVDDETELVLITDGTELLDADEINKRVTCKKYCILLESVGSSMLDSYKKCFDTVLVANVSSVDDAMKHGLEFSKCR